jgi:flagellin
VSAEARLSVQLTGITSADNSVINIGSDSYALGNFGGDMERLTEALAIDGYNAVFDQSLNAGSGGVFKI